MKHTLNQYLLCILVIIIASGCATMQGRWENTKAKDTILAYEEFLKRYPEGGLSGQAQKRLEELYFADAKAKDTILAYEEFLKLWPQGNIAEKARIELEVSYFEQAKLKDTILAYEEFIT